MRPAVMMAEMPIQWFSSAAIQDSQSLMKKSHTKVQEQKKRGVEFPGHREVKAAIERPLAIVCENEMDGCLP